jgi:hypothetical protein
MSNESAGDSYEKVITSFIMRCMDIQFISPPLMRKLDGLRVGASRNGSA